MAEAAVAEAPVSKAEAAEASTRKKRRVVPPIPVSDVKQKLMERANEVLLANTAAISGALEKWDTRKLLVLDVNVEHEHEAELLADYYRTFNYKVKVTDSATSPVHQIEFEPLNIVVKADELLKAKGKKKSAAKK